MSKLEIIDSSSLNEWYEYFDKLKNKGIYHDPKYITILAEHFDGEANLCVFGNEDVFVYYPYYKRSLEHLPYADKMSFDISKYFDIVSSWYYGGPIVSDPDHKYAKEIANEFCKVFTEYCKGNGIVSEFIRFDPNLRNYRYFSCLNPEFDRETVYVDLRKNEKEIWNMYEKRNQRAIRKAMNSRIVVEKGKIKNLKVFSEIYLKEMVRKKALKHYWFSYETLKKLFTELKNNFELVVAIVGDDVIGGFIIARGYGIGHHFLSASLPEYWKFRVNNLMYHKAIMVCKELGDSIFDFQGGRKGVFEFKKGFSPLRRKFYISKMIRDEKMYSKLVEMAKSYEVTKNGRFFPEYRPKE